MYFSKNSKTFCLFFIAFLESKVNFKHLEKKMSLTAQVFLKLLTPKDVLLKCIVGLVFENPLAVNMLTSPKKY